MGAEGLGDCHRKSLHPHNSGSCAQPLKTDRQLGHAHRLGEEAHNEGSQKLVIQSWDVTMQNSGHGLLAWSFQIIYQAPGTALDLPLSEAGR